jgi:phage baseplate assembly protein W
MPLPPAPVSFGPFDGGDDVDCRGDHGKSLAIATGIRNLGNALARRLTTPRGALVSDAGYGTDIRRYLNGGLTAAQLARVKSEVAAEVSKDDRVQSPDVTVTANAQQASLTIKIVSELAPGAPFAFVFRATSLTVAFLDARPV